MPAPSAPVGGAFCSPASAPAAGHLSGRENIKLNGSILGLTDREVTDRMEDIIAFSELGEHIEQPIRTYSMGMKARLGFAVAAHLEPEVLLIDEVMAVGDAAFRQWCQARIREMVSGDTTVVIVSHNMNTVSWLATVPCAFITVKWWLALEPGRGRHRDVRRSASEEE